MKKILAMILAIMMLLSMAACGQGKPAETTEAPTVAPTTETPTEATEELESGAVVKGAAELILAKHRNGEQGRVSLKFIGECTKFVDVDEQNREDEPPQYVPPTTDDYGDYDDACSDCRSV